MCCIAGALAIGIVLRFWIKLRGGKPPGAEGDFAPLASRPGPHG